MSNIAMWQNMPKDWLKDYSVVIVCVSVGNVPQLTGDLLISSRKLERVSSIYSPALVPIIGADPYQLDSPRLCSAADVYMQCPCDVIKMAIIQIRSGIVKKYKSNFLSELVSSLKEEQVKEIIILSSSFAHEKHRVMSSSYRYYKNELFTTAINQDWIEHERVDGELIIHGGGFASDLIEECTKGSVPALILFKYCSEGDNIPDAVEFVSQLNKVLPMFKEEKKPLGSQLKEPVSWKLMFGGPPPGGIY